MKRIFLYAMMAAGVLASCSQSENDGLPEGDIDLTPSGDKVFISAVTPSASITTSTRSSGSIGADGTELNNAWSGQELHIFAFQKNVQTGKTIGEKITTDRSKLPFYDKVGVANSGSEFAVEWKDNLPLYFPRSGAYDFFGYYADDALIGALLVENNTMYSNFRIDGSQDLLIAKAALTEADKTALGNNEAEYNKAYSSYTARKGVQPRMKFEHLLTRLVFKVKGMGSSHPENVYVKAVRVKSRATGKLVFAYVEDTDKGAFFNGELVDLSLQERNAKEMQPLDNGIVIDEAQLPEDKADAPMLGKYPASANGVTEAKVVGEALLVEPSDKYDIEVDVVQYYNASDKLIPSTESRNYTYKETIKASDVVKDGDSANIIKFAASTSYNVTIQVYGLEEIKLTAELSPWIYGGDVPVNPEDKFEDVQ